MPEGGILILAEPSGQAMGNFAVTSLGAALSVYGEHGAPALTLSGLGELGGTLVFYTRDGEITTMLP